MHTLQRFPQPQPSQSERPFVVDIQKKHLFDLTKNPTKKTPKTASPWKCLSGITEQESNLYFLVWQAKVAPEAHLSEVQIKLSEPNWMSWSPIIDRGTPTCFVVVVSSTNMTEEVVRFTLTLHLPFPSLPSLSSPPLCVLLHLHRGSLRFVEGQRLSWPLHPI